MEGVFSESLPSEAQSHQVNHYCKSPSFVHTSGLISNRIANNRVVSALSLVFILGIPLVFGFYIFEVLVDALTPSIALAVSWILILVLFAGIGRWAQNTSSGASRLR